MDRMISFPPMNGIILSIIILLKTLQISRMT